MKRKLALSGLLCLTVVTVLAQDTWTRKADLPGGARAGGAAFSINGKGYMGLGGRTDLWEYDPVTNTWTQKADFPGGPRTVPSTMSVGDKGFVGMGFSPSSFDLFADWWEFDPIANNWTQKGNFPGTPRIGTVTFTIGSKGYLGVGLTIALLQSINTMDFWQYDPAADQWTMKAPFPAEGYAREYAAGFSIGGKGYLGTGSKLLPDKGPVSVNDFYAYDPVADSWTRKKDVPGNPRDRGRCFCHWRKGIPGPWPGQYDFSIQ